MADHFVKAFRDIKGRAISFNSRITTMRYLNHSFAISVLNHLILKYQMDSLERSMTLSIFPAGSSSFEISSASRSFNASDTVQS